jgi:hypothetical protein
VDTSSGAIGLAVSFMNTPSQRDRVCEPYRSPGFGLPAAPLVSVFPPPSQIPASLLALVRTDVWRLDTILPV